MGYISLWIFAMCFRLFTMHSLSLQHRGKTDCVRDFAIYAPPRRTREKEKEREREGTEAGEKEAPGERGREENMK